MYLDYEINLGGARSVKNLHDYYMFYNNEYYTYHYKLQLIHIYYMNALDIYPMRHIIYLL